MKWLSLIKSRLTQYFVYNKLVFVIFILGSVVCGTGFLHLYGNFTSAFILQRNMSVSGRTFTVGFSQTDSPSRGDIGQILRRDGLSLETCVVKAREEETGGNLLAVAAGKQSFTSIDGQKTFTDEEMETGSPVVIIPAVFVHKPAGLNKSANTLTIENTTLEIVGRNNSDFDYYVPAKTFDDLNLPVESMMLVTPRFLNEKEDDALLNRLAALFPGAEYIDSPGAIAERVQRQQLGAQLVMLCAVYGLSVLSFLFLMKYMIDRSRMENVIYCIVGCSKDVMMQLTLLENVCLSGITALLSIGIHIALKKPVFDKISLQAFTYAPRDYILCFIMMVLVSLVASIPFIVKVRKHSLIMVKNSYAYS